MREFAFDLAPVAVALAWLAIWAGLLHIFGVSPFRRRTEGRNSRRERLKRLGKFRYVLTFGVLGGGVAFGLAMTGADVVSHRSHGWAFELIKFVFLAVMFGLAQGFGGWRSEFRDPVPFPPDYPPTK